MFSIGFVLIPFLVGVALAQDDNCDFSQDLEPGKTYNISSPRWPALYGEGLACRWMAYAPQDYKVVISCSTVQIPETQNCYQDRLLVSTSGDPQLNAADRYCGTGTLRDISDGTVLSVGLISDEYSRGGRFSCLIYAQQSVTPPPVTCHCGWKKSTRIVGGKDADPNEFTMMAGIRYKHADQISCGGVIVAERYVVTAAHCLVGQALSNVEVIVGEHNQDATNSYRQVIQPSRFIIHSQYSDYNNDNDIGIIVLSENIQYNNRVGPVCLPFKFGDNSFVGKQVTILGWGTTFFGGPTTSVLQKANVNVISQSSCASSVNTLTPRQLCTYTKGKDACQMDSGGPLLYEDPSTGLFFSAGIVSTGRSCASGSPGVNTRLTSYLNWIQANTPGVDYCRK